MEWISSLFSVSCPFCDYPLQHCQRVCESCSIFLTALEDEELIWNEIETLPVLSLFRYEGWVQSLILRQKKAASGFVLRWMAKLIQKKKPQAWVSTPLVWIPGMQYSRLHFVDQLALELEKIGQPLSLKPLLRRKFSPFFKPQKALSLEQRHSRDLSLAYRVNRQCDFENKNILLLDDVFTTGSTLLGCKTLLENELGLRVIGALTLGYTPLRLKKSSKQSLPEHYAHG